MEKVRTIVGLNLNPPEKAMVLCVDEKTQIQVLDCTQPLLPMGLGCVEGDTHDDIRHGTTSLFAAHDVATGEVLTQCRPRHRQPLTRKAASTGVPGFLRQIEMSLPEDLGVHPILVTDCTHKHDPDRRYSAQR